MQNLEARLTIRIVLSQHVAIGPGKIRLMELIGECGSISAAARAMQMSYRRAWTLVDELNTYFLDPLVEKQIGGTKGGGAGLTKLGQEIVMRYRNIEQTCSINASKDLNALLCSMRKKECDK